MKRIKTFDRNGRASRWTTILIAVGMLSVISMPFDHAHAVESGRLVEKDGQYVFVESMDPATRLLLERAYEKGNLRDYLKANS